MLKNYPKFDIKKKRLERCTIRMSLLTLQKDSAILQCMVTEIWTGQNTNFKSVCFGQNFKIFRQIRILIFVAQFQ